MDIATHMPPEHDVPSQQSLLLSQRPPVPWQHRPAIEHCIPSQQSPGVAHAAVASAQQAPSRQSSPVSHAVPPQQRSRAWPQRPGSGLASPAGWSNGMSSYPLGRPESWLVTGPVSRSATLPPAHATRPSPSATASASR
jgi:hypothetical protein